MVGTSPSHALRAYAGVEYIKALRANRAHCISTFIFRDYLSILIINMKPSQLYIHIPYCHGKCLYCDFYSGGNRTADWHRLTEAIVAELTLRRDELARPPQYVYIGGGTPSLMPGDCLMRLCDAIYATWPGMDAPVEFTIEVNPEDVTAEKCRVWKQCGVNRVSMGVQSFSDSELKAVGRRHDSKCAENAYDILRSEFDNVSLDLMFGLPGQTVESWGETVAKAVSLRPQHISAYTLMLEKGTALTQLAKEGRVELPGDEENLAMWHLLTRQLRENGYCQYEISNYALPGFESRHNSGYWSGNPYLGLGPSAHSYDGESVRRANPADMRGYIKHFCDGQNNTPFYTEEKLTPEERAEETVMLRMRTRSGIDLDEYSEAFGKEACNRLLANAESDLREGRLAVRDRRLMLTDGGIMTADSIILRLVM